MARIWGCSSIDPVAWSPAEPIPVKGNLSPNQTLSAAVPLTGKPIKGGETVAIDSQKGWLYTGDEEGHLLAFDLSISPPARMVEKKVPRGRILGLVVDDDGSVLIANHGVGLRRFMPSGELETLLTHAGGQSILFANGIDLGSDGWVYFSDASSKFNNSTLKGAPPYAPLDNFEARPHGRLIAYHLISGKHHILADQLYFANGVAVSHDGESVLVVETNRYRISRFAIQQDRTSRHEVVLDNLPGFADGLWRNPRGGYRVTFQADEMLPWHARALGVEWSALPSENYRTLLLAMIHVIGAAMLVAALNLLVSVWISLRNINRTLPVLLPAIALIFMVALFHGTWIVTQKTQAVPPLGPTLLLLVTVIFATGINLWLLIQPYFKRRKDETNG